MSKSYLIVEFLALFVVLPLGLLYLPWKLPPLPILWLATGCCLAVLLRDPTFYRRLLWNPAPLAENFLGILIPFLLAAAGISASVYFFAPELLFSFVRANPGFWALVMLLYPVLSVYPQSIIYRAFLIHRYQPLFCSPQAIVLASATAFSFMHIILHNPLAIWLTFVGGLLFACRYQKTGSLFVSSLEHALYGCLLFTIGLGRYFYTRAI